MRFIAAFGGIHEKHFVMLQAIRLQFLDILLHCRDLNESNLILIKVHLLSAA